MQQPDEYHIPSGALGDHDLLGVGTGVGTSFRELPTDDDLLFALDGFNTYTQQRQYGSLVPGDPSGYPPERYTWDPGAADFTDRYQSSAYLHVAGGNNGAIDFAAEYFTPLQAAAARAQPNGSQRQAYASTSAPRAIPLQQEHQRWPTDGAASGGMSIKQATAPAYTGNPMQAGNVGWSGDGGRPPASPPRMHYPQSARQAPYLTGVQPVRSRSQSRVHSSNSIRNRVEQSGPRRIANVQSQVSTYDDVTHGGGDHGNPEMERQNMIGSLGSEYQQLRSPHDPRAYAFSPPQTQSSLSHYAGSDTGQSQILPNVLDPAFLSGSPHGPFPEPDIVGLESMSPLDVRDWTGDAYNPGDRSVNPRQLMAHSAPNPSYQAGAPSRPMSLNTSISNMQGQYVCTSPLCKTPNMTFRSKADLEHHQRWHGPRTNMCMYCDADFVSSKDLKRHHSEKHDPNGRKFVGPFPGSCSFCARGFARRDHLSRHLRSHGVLTPTTSSRGMSRDPSRQSNAQ